MILFVVFLLVCCGLILEALLLGAAAQHRRHVAERAYWARQRRPVELYNWADDPGLWS